ncbi:hypothetical protein [Agromyces sp. Marseille-P2726]|uniref:hypothetical protein n=1 Tax=Agromyces sp. Marseille-P2726 TaxID=2709132 RepID=UPI001570556B|nr:hypothetical protein [Agromyces sp. Marseille-P2726]
MHREVRGRDGAADGQRQIRAVQRARPSRTPDRVPGARAPVLHLQSAAGNRAVSGVLTLRPVVQRTQLYMFGGGRVTDFNGPGTNERKAVELAQKRLIALGVLTASDAAADKARIAARTGRIMAGDISNTTAAIDRCDIQSVSEPMAKTLFKANLVAGVGVGETNDAADVDLVLNLLHEEHHVTNDEFEAGETVIEGVGRTVDPALVPGFLAGLTRMKRGYAGGYPFRGSTKRRKKLLVTEGTAAYQRALDYNNAGRAAMQRWLESAAAQSRDKVLRNSAEWCLSGRIKLYCTTKTHDSAARVKANGSPKRFYAIFGHPLGALSERQVPYLRKLRGQTTFDNTNVAIEAPSGGSAPAGAITVVDPVPSGRKAFYETIKHEVQHTADHHPATDEGRYKSELNARWVDGGYAGYSPRRRVRAKGFTWNERQYAIFLNLWKYKDLYPYVRANWNDPDAGKRAAWRTMVVGYKKPASFNPINSVRIEGLHEAIAACTPADCAADDLFRAGTGPENVKAAAVKRAMGALDALDRATIKTNTDLNASASSNLSGTLLAEFRAL